MKVLILANHRQNRNPGQRFRYEQYLDFLREKGVDIDISFFISEKDDKYIYKKGYYFRKLLFHFRAQRIRRKDIRRLHLYDMVFLFREAYFFGNIKLEKAIRKRVANIIYDFDDAIWIPNVSEANKRFSWLKDYDKTAKIIALSDMIFVGNSYLKEYAEKHNNNVKIIPTTIDTEEYKPYKRTNNSKVCIGWSGSITTIQHFNYAVKILKQIKQKYAEKVEIKLIGDKNYVNKDLNVEALAWVKQTEIEDLCSFDIGIMPLPDDKWAKGKCGLKGLQYMALEIPTIMSPVGVNTEIIQDGENGFLADSDDEWIDKISRLIESEELRKKLGIAGRKTVIEKYSVEVWKDKYLEYFQEVIRNAKT